MMPSVNRLPWETVSTDLIGPLPRSSKGNSYLVVFVDRFTKWVQCRPIRKATGKAVRTALYEEVLTRFGCPKTIITDNGTQYTGKWFKELLSDFGIQHRLTPPYHPQANPVERTNRTLKTMIAQYCQENHKQWDQELAGLMYAMNTARHDSTGFTPAFLNFGRELEIPPALHRSVQPPSHPEEMNEPEDEMTQQAEQVERLQKLKDIFELVRINLAAAFASQSKHYNLRRREWRCHLGDKVMKREHHLSSAAKGFAAKLAPKFSGPYTVVRVISPVVYEIKGPHGRRQKVHVKDLKPVNTAEEEGR